MKYAGSESWHFAEGLEGLSHAALYVRDAVGLKPVLTADIPPRLSGTVPNRRAVLTGAERDQASGQWPRWWRAVIACESREYGDESTGPYGRLDEFQNVADPPHFDSLGEHPALQKAARATFAEAYRWTAQRRREVLNASDPSVFNWMMLQGIADEVASRRGVTLGKVRGFAVVLMVKAKWWASISPGVVACSVSAARDPTLAQAIINTAFETALVSG